MTTWTHCGIEHDHLDPYCGRCGKSRAECETTEEERHAHTLAGEWLARPLNLTEEGVRSWLRVLAAARRILGVEELTKERDEWKESSSRFGAAFTEAAEERDVWKARAEMGENALDDLQWYVGQLCSAVSDVRVHLLDENREVNRAWISTRLHGAQLASRDRTCAEPSREYVAASGDVVSAPAKPTRFAPPDCLVPAPPRYPTPNVDAAWPMSGGRESRNNVRCAVQADIRAAVEPLRVRIAELEAAAERDEGGEPLVEWARVEIVYPCTATVLFRMGEVTHGITFGDANVELALRKAEAVRAVLSAARMPKGGGQ